MVEDDMIAGVNELEKRAMDDVAARLMTEQGAEFDHLGVAVRSLASGKAFYAGVLGLTVMAEETVETEQVRVAMLGVGQSRIELLEPTAEDSVIGRFLARRGEGLHHIALRVRGLEVRFEQMQAAGVRLASKGIGVGAGGQRYFFVHPEASGGVLLELVEPAAGDTA